LGFVTVFSSTRFASFRYCKINGLTF